MHPLGASPRDSHAQPSNNKSTSDVRPSDPLPTAGINALRKQNITILYSTRAQRTPAPNNENALSGDYPIARPLFMYTLGKPKPHVKAYLDWCLSPEGQKVVEATGYVPAPKK